MEATDTSTKDDIRDLLEKVSHCKISPIPYSPLILFGMQETDISRLLAFFLNAKEHHGAGTGFLEKFQDLIPGISVLISELMHLLTAEIRQPIVVSLSTF